MLATTTADLLDTVPFAPAGVCRHCGDACDERRVETADGWFCCGGCQAVFGLIKTHELTAFYACDVRPGTSQKNSAGRDAARFAALDDPEIARRFLIAGRGVQESSARFVVPALHCASCIWLVEQLWRFDAGICRSEVDLLRRTVRVAFRPDATTLRAIAERLASLGYEPILDAEPAGAETPTARKDLYLRLGVAGFAFGNVMLFSIPRYASGGVLEPAFQHLFDTLNILFAIPVLLFSASPYFTTARAALRARTMALEIPVAIGLVALFARSVADITTGRGEGFLDSFSGLVFFLLVGRLFQQKAFDGISFDRTIRSFFPLSVRVERRSDGVELTPIEQLQRGDIIQVRPQEVVPADALLLDAAGAIDYAFVTGESAPATVQRGEPVQAGGRVVDRTLRLAVTQVVSQSRLAELWTHPVFAKAKTHWLTLVTARFGWWFTVAALGLAAAGAIAWWPDVRSAVSVATAVLIIACPCALTLAAPITLGTAMGVLGRAGCYLKNPLVALDLSRIDTIAFDKTGTLTTVLADGDRGPAGLSRDEWQAIRRLAAESVHPVSRAYAGDSDATLSDVLEHPGQGVTGLVNGRRVVLGRASFVSAASGRHLGDDTNTTWAWIDGASPRPLPTVHPERPGMDDAIRSLGRRHDLWLLTGDRWREAGRFAGLFGDHIVCELTPERKLAAVHDHQARGRRVLMVGDGLNDAGALAAADVGLAVSDQTACLVPACDAVIRGDRLQHLPIFLRYARRARRVVAACFAVSILYNALGLSLALTGHLTPFATAVLMPISSLTVVGLSVGLMRRGSARVIRP